MSETYTIGGDALYLLEANHIAGQTFTPLESHALYYLDLNLKTSFYTAPPKVQVYLTNAAHEPTGDPLLNITIHPPSPIIPKINRFRVKIPTPFILHAGTEYALLCLYDAIVIGTRASWEYDSATATYPRGHRIHSEDGGTTWTHELGSDHIFCEFGDPPLPKQEPEPPVEPFAPVGIKYSPTWFGLLIVLTTATPCHLTCYYTEKKPLKHPSQRIIRGINVLWGSYFCFVAWHALEQIEPGDTLYHTFNFEEWAVCLTRWFTFRGEVDNLQSPSVGPIFEYHNLGVPPMEADLRVYAPGDLCYPRFIGPGPDCPDHWQRVTTLPGYPPEWYLYGYTINKWWGYDSYLIEKCPFEKIASIEHHMHAKRSGGYPYIIVYGHLLRIDGTNYFYGLKYTSGDWQHHVWKLTQNPKTGLPWTQADINTLQVGVGLRYTWGVGWSSIGLCDEVFLRVKRAID